MRSGRALRSMGFLGVVALVGCGDPVVGTEYAGKPLFTLGGTVMYDEDGSLGDHEVYVVVLYEALTDSGYTYLPPYRLQTSFPADYVVEFFEPPAEEIFKPAPDDRGEMALGSIMVYLDEDGSGSFDPEADALVGGNNNIILLYVTEDWPEHETPRGLTSDALEPGFQVVYVEGGCPGEAPIDVVDPMSVTLYVDDDYADRRDDCGPDEGPPPR